MKNISLIILFLIFFLITNLNFSCQKEGSTYETIWVYKTNNDYSDKVPVELSKDKSKITAFPGPNDIQEKWPVKLINGYFLNGSFGVNTGFLSLTKSEYSNYSVSPGADSLYKLLIDNDPFTFFYQRNDHNNVFYTENGAYGIDTVMINDLIRKDDLVSYFEKLK